MSMQNLIDRPIELLELINSCLKPKDIEKKKFGEVFTPIKLIGEMINNLEARPICQQALTLWRTS